MTPHLIAWAALACVGAAHAADPAPEGADATAARLEALQRQVSEQSARLESLRRAMAQEEASLAEVKRALGTEVLASQRARGVAPDAVVAQDSNNDKGTAPKPVGQAPETEGRAPVVAPIFEQPGVLTAKGKMVLEPALQYSYSSSSRVALVGYTIIPAITIGLIDVREVKRNTFNATLSGRYGVTNRFEIEARVPYSYRSDSNIGCQLGQGCVADTVFSASGRGVGDVEVTGRYQFNDGGLDKPFYVGSLRFKSRTGKDPFDVTTDDSITGLSGGVQTELPTGSGFYGLQPALTVLFPSDPAVFFGTVSYLHNFARSNVVQQTSSGPRALGKVAAGDVIGFNFGLGLGLNEKSSFSIGYDHASVARTKLNGEGVPGSVRVQLGTLLLGYSYRLNPQRTLSVSLGAGITRDTPDMTLTVRMPVTF